MTRVRVINEIKDNEESDIKKTFSEVTKRSLCSKLMEFLNKIEAKKSPK
jgi:hypothetical protein